MRLGLSNYGSLTNRKFEIVKFIKSIAEDGGADHTRCFTDLAGKDPLECVFLYPWNKITKRFKLGTVNQEFVDRLGAAGLEARKHNLQIVLDGMTDPSYQPFGIFRQMGYGNSKELIQRGNFPGCNWDGVTQYHADLAGVLKQINMPRVFAFWEVFNEAPGWGSIYEEVRDLSAKMKGAYRFCQWNPPGIQYPNQDGYDPVLKHFNDWEWPLKLIAGFHGIKFHRVAYHGEFNAAQIAKEIGILKKSGLPPTMLTFSTDGATPGFGFTYPDHVGGHYKARPTWKQHKAAVIKAHVEMVKTALKAGAAIEIQEMSAWFGDEITTIMDPDVVDFRKAMKLAAA